MITPTEDQANQALRLLYRLEPLARSFREAWPLTQEACQLFLDLGPGAVDELAEAVPGSRPSDSAAR